MALNLYGTLDEIKGLLGITGTTYDDTLTQALWQAGRLIDDATGRIFYPLSATRYVDADAKETLWLPETWVEASTISVSDDNGYSYTALAATDYWLSNGAIYDKTPYQLVIMNPNGDYGEFYSGLRAVKIVGVLGWHRDYSNAWEASGDTVRDTGGISAAATTITVTAPAADDAMARAPRFSIGNLLKIESEYIEVTGVGPTTLTVARGVNGTTAATHAQTTAIYKYRPDPVASEAALTQAARWFKRSQQAFADTGAIMELGQLTYAKKLDPGIEAILYEAGLRRVTVG